MCFNLFYSSTVQCLWILRFGFICLNAFSIPVLVICLNAFSIPFLVEYCILHSITCELAAIGCLLQRVYTRVKTSCILIEEFFPFCLTCLRLKSQIHLFATTFCIYVSFFPQCRKIDWLATLNKPSPFGRNRRSVSQLILS